MANNCGHCKFGVGSKGDYDEDLVTCHRNPPALGAGARGVWPIVSSDRACGEFKAKPKA